jgi:fibronectin type 3 domain-containing protein
VWPGVVKAQNPSQPSKEYIRLGGRAIAVESPAAVPAAPTGLSATAGNAQVSLSWNASTGATSYNVYRSDYADGEGGTPIATGIATTSYTNTGLTNGRTYYYKVAAVNGGGTSAKSNEASATPQSQPTASFVISKNSGAFTHSVTANVGDTITYQWSSTNGASYSFYDTITPGGADGCGNTNGTMGFTPAAGGSAGPYALIQCQLGYTYTMTYTVTASGGAQATDTITISLSQTVPPPPTGLTAMAGNAQVSLSWNASSGATSYNVYRGTSAGGESPTPIATGIVATAYTNTGLANDMTYYYKVAAVNSAGTSAKSNEASATPQAGGLPPPTGLTATPYSGSVFLLWNAVSGATSYNVYRGTSPGGENPTPIATGMAYFSTYYSDYSVSNGTTYYYKVAAVSGSGTSPLSNEAFATPTSGSIAADLLLQSLTVTSGTVLYQAHNSITAQDNFIVSGSAAVTFQAGSTVRLEPGFHATAGTAGTTLHAFIDPAIQ